MVGEGASERFDEILIEERDSISREDLLKNIKPNFERLSLSNIESFQEIILPIQEDILEIVEHKIFSKMLHMTLLKMLHTKFLETTTTKGLETLTLQTSKATNATVAYKIYKKKQSGVIDLENLNYTNQQC